MGKVKQAIQEVEEEIISLVEDGFKLNEIKTTFNYRKAMNDFDRWVDNKSEEAKGEDYESL